MKTTVVRLCGVSVMLILASACSSKKVKVSDLEYPPTRANVRTQPKLQPASNVQRPQMQPRRPAATMESSGSGITGRTSTLGTGSSGRSR